MPNMDVKKRTLLLGALLFLVFALAASRSARAQDNGIFRDGYDEPGSCFAGRATMTVVSWKYNGSGRRNIDVTQAENIWGRWDAGQTPTAFPWLNVFALLWALPRHNYVAAEFTIPEGTYPLQWGLLNHGATSGGPPMDVSISTQCGDFNPPEPFCSKRNVMPGENMIGYKLPAYPGIAFCSLTTSGPYYINLRVSDPNVDHPDCPGAACKFNIQNNHTP
jgi:hypothetical protein